MAGVVAGTYFGDEEGRADGFSDCGGLEYERVDGVWAGEETGGVAASWPGIVLAERRMHYDYSLAASVPSEIQNRSKKYHHTNEWIKTHAQDSAWKN